MEAGEGLQQDHAEADALDGVEDAEPEPVAAAHDGGGGGPAGPGHVRADVGGAPEHLGPARGAEADGEDGQDPAVGCGQAGEEVEEGGPDEDEEEEHEQEDGVGGHVLGGEEVEPVAAVGRRQEVVLDRDDDEEPEDDLAPEERGVERRHFAGRLPVVFWQADEENGAYGPHEERDDEADDADDFRVRGRGVRAGGVKGC